MRFRPEQHVRRQRDFRDIRERGRRYECGCFTLWHVRRPVGEAESAPGPAEASKPAESSPDASGALDVSTAPAARTEPVITMARAGVVASTASVGNAVLRNRAKRRLREVFRRNQQLVPKECDILLIARTSLNKLEYAVIEQKFVESCSRLFPRHS